MDIIALGNHWLLILVLSVPRFLVIFIILPFFGNSFLPGLLRNSVAIVLSIPVLPIVEQQVLALPFDELLFLQILMKEVVVGLMMGYVVGIIFWSIVTSGSIIDMQRGAMSAQMFNPIVSGQSPPLGAFFSLAAVTFFFTTGGFLIFLSVIYASYVTWPVPSFYPDFNKVGIPVFLNQFDLLSYTGLLLAAPAIIFMFTTEFSIGLVGRFVPAINIFILSMPLKSAIAFFVLSFYLSTMFYYIKREFISVEYFQKILVSILG